MRALAVWLIGVMGAGLLVPGAPAAAKKKNKPPGPTFLYLHHNLEEPEVLAYRLDAEGSLTALAGSPFAVPGEGITIASNAGTLAFLAERRLLFAATQTGNSVLRVAEDGALTPVPGSPFGGTAAVSGLAVTKRGKRHFVFGAENDVGAKQVRALELGEDDSLDEVPGSPYPAPNPVSLAIAGTRLICGSFGGAGEVFAFDIGKDGALTSAPGSPFDVPALALHVYASPTGKHVYVPHGFDPVAVGLSVKKKADALKPLAGSPFATGVASGNSGMALSGGNLLFAIGDTGLGLDNAQALRRAKNGALTTLGAPQYLGMDGVWGAALDRKARFLACWSGFADEVRLFSVAGSGGLTHLQTLPETLNETLVTGGLFAEL